MRSDVRSARLRHAEHTPAATNASTPYPGPAPPPDTAGASGSRMYRQGFLANP